MTITTLTKVYDPYYISARENLDQYECIEALPEPILEELTQEAGDADLSVELVKEWLLEKAIIGGNCGYILQH